ncbi:MAG TPA: hypothetical protein VE988_22570 [Gemmataceae bacterium]|nr:hypothetical protein [Gemmataceae bacterium]
MHFVVPRLAAEANNGTDWQESPRSTGFPPQNQKPWIWLIGGLLLGAAVFLVIVIIAIISKPQPREAAAQTQSGPLAQTPREMNQNKGVHNESRFVAALKKYSHQARIFSKLGVERLDPGETSPEYEALGVAYSEVPTFPHKFNKAQEPFSQSWNDLKEGLRLANLAALEARLATPDVPNFGDHILKSVDYGKASSAAYNQSIINIAKLEKHVGIGSDETAYLAAVREYVRLARVFAKMGTEKLVRANDFSDFNRFRVAWAKIPVPPPTRDDEGIWVDMSLERLKAGRDGAVLAQNARAGKQIAKAIEYEDLSVTVFREGLSYLAKLDELIGR